MPHNLPSRLTSFIGREHEIAEITALLGEHRLITLVGAPGVGKTRLSLQIATALLDTFADGVWLVELAPLADPSLVPQAAADALGVPEQPSRPLTASLADWLRSRRLLLLLDNCEHLIGPVAALADALLPSCPRLHVLATSREPLAIDGEVVRRVPPLAVPDAGALRNAADALPRIADADAVRLFVDRARAADGSLVLTTQNAPIVVQICQRLDGIPLALELAASRIRALSPEQIAARLDDRFRLLTGGSRTALPRQQTLRGAVDWSYDLLSEQEQTLLRRLAVFSVGFTLDAAEAVCPVSFLHHASILDLLVSLVDRSLIQVDDASTGDRRYRLLETLRDYGMEKLAEHGELASARDRHLDYFLAVAVEAEPHLTGPAEGRTLARLDPEHDNLRAALSWSLDSDCDAGAQLETGSKPTGAAAAVRIAAGLWRFWFLRGHVAEARRVLSRAVEARFIDLTPEDRTAYVRARYGLAQILSHQGDYRAALVQAETCLASARVTNDPESIARAMHRIGLFRAHLGDYEIAAGLCEESLSLARQVASPYWLGMALRTAGDVAWFCCEFERVTQLFTESLALYREIGDDAGVQHSFRGLGNAALALGNEAEATRLFEEALPIAKRRGDGRGAAQLYCCLGQTARRAGDAARATQLLRLGIRTANDVGDRWAASDAIRELAAVRALQGAYLSEPTAGKCTSVTAVAIAHFRDAVLLYAAANALRETYAIPVLPPHRADYERNLAILRGHLGETTFEQTWTHGQSMSYEQAVEYALEITAPTEQAGAASEISTVATVGDAELSSLTTRERQVASLIGRGCSNRQIAAELVLSERTAETHVHNVLGKLGLTSRARLAVWAVEHGLRGEAEPRAPSA